MTNKSLLFRVQAMDVTQITMDQFETAKAQVLGVVIPVGSVEEHGHHLPLGTDTLHALEIAKRASRLRPILVGAPLWYGLCRSTSQHPGTITISGTTLRSLAMDIMRSYYSQGIKRQVILSGHAGGTHMSFLVDAAEEMVTSYPDLRCAVLSIIDLVRDSCKDIVETPGDSHAGEVETSIIQATYPGLVKGTSKEEYPKFPKYLIVREKRLYWPYGVWGDPSKASPNKGQSILDREAQRLANIIDELNRQGVNEDEKTR